ncbi:hypothetical protein RJ639_012566 [Escallonia herrerae]|uniref:Uncharacterized protein n=1 Tax=Escallonia herrerae TaxID=1293975 RepID=A0AA88VPP6_9ASTE|nr:hypothetical protein RJ639_012566 [Escallonia herrerae]
MYLLLVGGKPEAMNASEWVILDRKALATERLSLTPRVAFNISKEKTTAAVMKALEKLYEKPSASNKVFLMKKLFNMRMSENGYVVDHLNNFNGVTNQLKSVGINFDDKIRVLLFMCSLHVSWNNLVTTVSNSTISGTLTLNDVVSSLMNDEMRRKTIGDALLEREKVEIKLSNGGTLVLKDVRHIPELQKNLISVSGLDREGYFVAFGEKQWNVIKGSMVVARGERVGTIYTLSDDASRKTWIYAISEKSNVYHTFKKWKALVENERGNKIKCLKSDIGGEYRDGGFQEFCSNNGIRLIRTKSSLSLNGGIPEEEWSGKPVNYSFLRVFGCIAYAHIDKEERKKLDFKSQKCVFIGYEGDEYGYRLWDCEDNKIIRSRDVIFDESQLYNHKLQEHGIKKENKAYMELDKPEDGQVPRTENPEVLDETTDTEIRNGDQQQVPETLNLRRSSRVRKAPDRLCSSMRRINEHEKKLASTFFMKDLSEAKQLLGMRITRDRKQKKLWLLQEVYIDKVLRRFNLHASKPDGQLNLEKIEGNKNPADMLTKVVDRQKLSLCSPLISLR